MTTIVVMQITPAQLARAKQISAAQSANTARIPAAQAMLATGEITHAAYTRVIADVAAKSRELIGLVTQ